MNIGSTIVAYRASDPTFGRAYWPLLPAGSSGQFAPMLLQQHALEVLVPAGHRVYMTRLALARQRTAPPPREIISIMEGTIEALTLGYRSIVAAVLESSYSVIYAIANVEIILAAGLR